jgi:serine/threonine-protein kinase
MGIKEDLGATWEVKGYPCEMGAYVLLRSLAKGGMGEVHLAKHGGLAGIQKYCVVKTLRRHATDDAEYVRRFVDEAAVVVSLQHKNICPVFDVGKVDGRYYLAMEFIAGRDLRALARAAAEQGEEISPALAIYIVGEMLEALDYAHRARDPNTGEPLDVVHRDISPQNIMLSFEGEAKLIDFGLAASTLKKEQTNPNIIMGKLAYMPPEQLDGKSVDGRADLFAAAVVLYELLARERFYEGLSDAEILAAASSRSFQPRKLKDLDPELATIVGDALSPDRTQRLPDCGELKDRLVRYQVARKIHARSRDLRRLLEKLFPEDAQKTRGMLAQFAAVRAPSVEQAEKSQRIAVSPQAEPPDPPGVAGILELESMSDDMLRAAAETSIEVDTALLGTAAPAAPAAPGSLPLDPSSLASGVGPPRGDGREPTEPTRDIQLPVARAPAVAVVQPNAPSSPAAGAPSTDPFANVPTSAPSEPAAEATVVVRTRTGEITAPPEGGSGRTIAIAAAGLVAVLAVAAVLLGGGEDGPPAAAPPPASVERVDSAPAEVAPAEAAPAEAAPA